ncbi:MAG: folate-binding protein, partial [Elusimicrobia bacterium]|nr:folate-binding protein [Elusimicrobiota bacterium]
MDEAYFPLRDWRLFRLAGADRKDFLHGLVTNDVKALAPGRELPCCLLTPKGLLQAHFWVYEWKEALLLA